MIKAVDRFSLFQQPQSISSKKDIKHTIKEGMYITPTPEKLLSCGDEVVISGLKNEDDELSNMDRAYIGKSAVLSAFDEKSDIPDTIEFEDEALLLKDFYVVKVGL